MAKLNLTLVIQTVTFHKQYDWTTLRVRFRGTLRGGHGWSGGSGRWLIYFNGAACSSPAPIESANYNGNSDVHHHKTTGSK